MQRRFLSLFFLFLVTLLYLPDTAIASDKVSGCFFDDEQHVSHPKTSIVCVTNFLGLEELLVQEPLKQIIIKTKKIGNEELTIKSINLLAEKELELQIEGLCAGDCSRLLAPASSSIKFEKNGVLVLTNSSMPFYTKNKFVNSVVSEPTKYKPKDYYFDKYSAELDMFENLELEIEYLSWHRFVEKNLIINNEETCSVFSELAIIISPHDLKNFGLHRKKFVERDIKKLVHQVSQFFPQHNIALGIIPDKFEKCGKRKSLLRIEN